MRIRRFKETDYTNLFETISDPEVMKYIEPPYSAEKAKKFFAETGLCEEPLIYAAETDNGQYVGYVIYHSYDAQSIEIGWILKRSEWGKGYAKELTGLMITKARKAGKSVIIECSPEQQITKHIAESYGFEYRGEEGGVSIYKLQ